MSVTFSIRGVDLDVEDFSTYVNLSNANARVLLRGMGLPHFSLEGELRAKDMATKCQVYLTALEERGDEGEKGFSEKRFHFFGRSPGLLTKRTKELLALCEKAGDLGWVTWA